MCIHMIAFLFPVIDKYQAQELLMNSTLSEHDFMSRLADTLAQRLQQMEFFDHLVDKSFEKLLDKAPMLSLIQDTTSRMTIEGSDTSAGSVHSHLLHGIGFSSRLRSQRQIGIVMASPGFAFALSYSLLSRVTPSSRGQMERLRRNEPIWRGKEGAQHHIDESQAR
eukprot:gnl/MRDRNA2_/MRDRNA2_21161_c0_seq2.p1 gnl/MRDRNA2_/MRDRNA2_21161_c0~~gnl/MRDRNA2_/MRDRNA2_21161_c0_seq2.p1  ORF type:complete len:166 (-),score=20.71 gnl/MRDRNA2_/MRDRNA2_21161_c0_seq2:292-789(-)